VTFAGGKVIAGATVVGGLVLEWVARASRDEAASTTRSGISTGGTTTPEVGVTVVRKLWAARASRDDANLTMTGA
jgi:hypothetical protein